MSETKINIGITKVKLSKFVITAEGAKDVAPETASLNVDFGISITSLSDKTFVFSMTAGIGRLIAERVVKLAEISMDTGFVVNNLSEFSFKGNDGILYFKRELINVIFDIALSQIRGAWVTQVDGTNLEWITLPLISGDHMLGDAKSFKVKPG